MRYLAKVMRKKIFNNAIIWPWRRCWELPELTVRAKARKQHCRWNKLNKMLAGAKRLLNLRDSPCTLFHNVGWTNLRIIWIEMGNILVLSLISNYLTIYMSLNHINRPINAIWILYYFHISSIEIIKLYQPSIGHALSRYLAVIQ
jgi:hypothetical protein